MDRHDLIIFDLNCQNPDDTAILYKTDNGKWVKHEDAINAIAEVEERNATLRDGIKHLRHSRNGSMEQYNIYADNLLEATK